jgi:hypothetical protein
LELTAVAAAYVYDAVFTYAQALSFLIKNKNLSAEQVMKLTQEGRTVLDTIIAIKNFSSKFNAIIKHK